jgi:hypothetical protein
MRTKEAARYLNTSKSWLDKSAAAHTGPVYRKIGHRREYDQPDLDEYKRLTRVEPRRATELETTTGS